MVEPSQNPSFDLYNQKLQPALDSMKYHISSAVDAKTGECPENFKCGICLQLVHLPEQCSSCDQMFCKECIMEWRVKRKQTCSNCKKETISEPLNRILKKILDETMLKGCPIEGCQASQTSMTYEQLIKHQQSQCQQVLVSCPYDKCKRTFKRSEGLQHFAYQCEEVPFKCPTCETTLVKKEQYTHNCYRDLKNKISDQEKVIQMLTQRLDELTKHVGDIDKKLDKNQIHQQIAQLAIEKQFFKGMNRFEGNIIYKQNNDLYCDLHGNRLLKIENRSHAYCNACGFNFQVIASLKRRTLGTLPSWTCFPCDFDICEYCMQNSDYFK